MARVPRCRLIMLVGLCLQAACVETEAADYAGRTEKAPESCSAGAVDQAACRTTCQVDTHCEAGQACVEGVCVMIEPDTIEAGSAGPSQAVPAEDQAMEPSGNDSSGASIDPDEDTSTEQSDAATDEAAATSPDAAVSDQLDSTPVPGDSTSRSPQVKRASATFEAESSRYRLKAAAYPRATLTSASFQLIGTIE